ncbi:hypothetical protein VF21_01712 [Pseudogymnoascus sp. 05NY08]|nr:hypothetical protein VF21_01712 [Pseudogymnoascus sp. 05NY08]
MSRVVRCKKANEGDQVKATYAASTLLLFAGGRPSLFTNRICFGVGSTTVDILPAPLPADHKLILHEEPGRELDKLGGLSIRRLSVSKLRVVEGEGKPGKAGINRLSQASAIVKSAAVWSCVGEVHGRLG